MKYRCTSLKLYPNGFVQVYIDPTQWKRFVDDMNRYKKDEVLTIEIKKWYKRRTQKQLNVVWMIAERICSDKNSSSYGDVPENVYLGIKAMATNYGYPLVEVKIGDKVMKVPKSFSNESDVTTEEGKILVDTAILIASECGADIEDIIDEMNRRANEGGT